MIIPRSVALLGLGFGPLSLATLGLLSASDAPAEPAHPPVFPTWVNRMPYPAPGGGGSVGGGGSGPMWITFDEPNRKPLLITDDGTEVYERRESLNLGSLLSGLGAIVPYRPTSEAVQLAGARPAGRPASRIDVGGLVALLTIYQAVADVKRTALRSAASFIAALAQREAAVAAREIAAAREAEQLRLAQQEVERQQVEIDQSLAVAEPAFDLPQPDVWLDQSLDGYDEPMPAALALPAQPVWRAALAGACLVGAVAIVVFTVYVVTLQKVPAAKLSKSKPKKKPRKPKKTKKRRTRRQASARRLAA